MLKNIFFILAAANALLLAYGFGVFGTPGADKRQPDRIREQLATDQLALLSASTPLPPAPAPAAEPASAAANAPAGAAAAEPAAAVLIACTAAGPFAQADARRFDTLIEPLKLGERVSQETVSVPEVSSHMVMIPPLGSKDAADKKAAELKERGVSNYFIMNDGGAKWAISLGVFKSEAAAQTLLAALRKQGVAGAKVVARSTQASRISYKVRDLDTDTRARLEAAAEKAGGAELRSCQ